MVDFVDNAVRSWQPVSACAAIGDALFRPCSVSTSSRVCCHRICAIGTARGDNIAVVSGAVRLLHNEWSNGTRLPLMSALCNGWDSHGQRCANEKNVFHEIIPLSC